MKRLLRLVALVAAFAVPAHAQTLTRLRIAYDGFSMTSAPLNYADQQGIFKKFGLDVTPPRRISGQVPAYPDAARERDTLREQHQAQLGAVTALTAAERARAERAEQQLDAERADRRHLTTALTPPGNGKLPRAAGGKGDQQ